MRRLALIVAVLVAILGAPVVLPQHPLDAVANATPTGSPVLIVLDLSSSMNEDDGTGITKLNGAKRSLVNLVNQMPRGSQLGLWTYPSKGSSCSSGGYETNGEVHALDDPRDLGATINSLVADGDTPTGNALKDAAESLKRVGKAKDTTIMLVSDGESNCNTDPCAVAKALAAENLQITINTVGFRISDAGKKELECIAEATQGKYMAVDDSAQLGKVLTAAAVPALELSTDTPQTAPTGATATLKATVKNISDRAVPGVQLGLQFRLQGDPAAVAPAVIPPRVDFGTLAPGESRERAWVVQTTPKGKPGNLNWSFGTWGDTTVPVRKSGTIRSTDEQLSGSGPILDMIRNSTQKAVVMGDSYSSGEGAGDYQSPDADHADMCHRSPHTYAAQVVGSAGKVNILACSGAVMTDLSGAQPEDRDADVTKVFRAARGQLSMLESAAAPSAVFLTLGGNDIGFAKIAQACLMNLPTDDCSSTTGPQSPRGLADSGLQRLSHLHELYQDVFARANSKGKRSARGGAIAPLLVLPYVMLLPETLRAKTCANLGPNEIRFLNDVEAQLNTKVWAEVAAARDAGVEAYFVDDVTTAFRPEGTMCDPAGNVVNAAVLEGAVAKIADGAANALGRGRLQGKYFEVANSGLFQELAHPTKAGYSAIASRILQWSRHTQREPVTTIPNARPLSNAAVTVDQRIDLGTRTRANLDGAGRAVADGLEEFGKGVQTKTGEFLEFVGKLPTSNTISVLPQAVGQLHSTPQIVGTTLVEPEGKFTLRVRIPSDLPAGRHTLEVFTFGDGEPSTGWRIPITVSNPLPWWLYGAAAVAASALLGSAVMFWRASRQGAIKPIHTRVR